MTGQIDLLITAAPTAVPQAQGGRLRALATTGDKRLSALPAVPTFQEAGLPKYKVVNWFGLAAPKGTPAAIVSKLQAEVKKALMDPALVAQLSKQGAEPGGMPSADFASFVDKETKDWAAVAKAANVKPE